MLAKLHLPRSAFADKERIVFESAGIEVSAFRYDTGVEAIRLANARGFVVVLPYMGQMVWDASFEGVRLTMGSLFDAPRPAQVILDTYGCYAYHSGLLRNGNPGPQDTHAPHGEMPVAPMDACHLELDKSGAVKLVSTREYRRGFGAHYLAEPSVTLAPEQTLFDITMQVRNMSGFAMDLMYMCHINPAFVEDGHIIQPAPWTPEHMTVRTAVPAHIPVTPAFQAQMAALAADPGRMEILDPSLTYDPEQVFYLHGLRPDADGVVHCMLRRPEGDGFAVSWRPDEFSHVVRWLMRNPDVQVAAFALPATCAPEGYTAERAKGTVRSLAPGASAHFSVRTGYLDNKAAAVLQAAILPV
jgi:hypothetical protein